MKTFQDSILTIFDRIRTHDFHPIRDGFTYDRTLNEHGVADLNAKDWLVRTLAVRDLVRIGKPAENYVISALLDQNHHVRHVAAMVAGILRSFKSVESLESALLEDSHEVVRSQAAVSLWQIGDKDSLKIVKKSEDTDESKDVRHQAELAAHAIRNNYTATTELSEAWRSLDEDTFNKVQTGVKALDFELPDAEKRKWRLADQIGKKPVVLIWIFADWCPVCHREFAELIEMQDELQDSIQFFTLECHDIYPARVMVGKELEPHYWFSEESFRETYTKKIWWPHLADRAAGVGTTYGVQPMAFTVHSEWINRPAVVIIDEEGIVRFTYYGTFWGDRPSIGDIKEMIETGSYDFESDKRLKKK